MIKTCKCGGRMTPHNFDAKDPIAKFQCDKCGIKRTQRKRKSKAK